MRQLLTWLFLSCKRYLKRPSFLLLMFLFPMVSWLLGQMSKTSSTEINIAIFMEDNPTGSVGERLYQALLTENQKETSLFRFYPCESVEMLMEEVSSRRGECGYVIPGDLEEILKSETYKRSFTVYSSPATVTAALSTEVVFSKLMELYNGVLLENYVREDALFESIGLPGSGERKRLGQEARDLYELWSSNGSTFQFEYGIVDNGKEVEEVGVNPSSQLFPIRGLGAIFVFVTGLFAATCMGKDERSGLFLPLSYETRLPCQLASVAAPVFLSAGSVMMALMVGGVFQGWWKELGMLFVYSVAVIVTGYVLGRLVKYPDVLCCLIPFVAIGCFLFCPVFFDIGRYIPGLQILGKCWLPYYYLRFF